MLKHKQFSILFWIDVWCCYNVMLWWWNNNVRSNINCPRNCLINNKDVGTARERNIFLPGPNILPRRPLPNGIYKWLGSFLSSVRSKHFILIISIFITICLNAFIIHYTILTITETNQVRLSENFLDFVL